MKATDLFKAMQTRTQIYIPTDGNGTILALVNGMTIEDGSGASWIVHVHAVTSNTHMCMYVRTTDNGKKFTARVMV